MDLREKLLRRVRLARGRFAAGRRVQAATRGSRPRCSFSVGRLTDPVGGEASTRRVWFYEIRTTALTRTGSGRWASGNAGENDIPDLLLAWRAYKRGGFAEPAGARAGTVLEPGSTKLQSWWAPVETVRDSDYSLTAARYRPAVGEAASDADPKAMTRAVLELEREIVTKLEELSAELEEVK